MGCRSSGGARVVLEDLAVILADLSVGAERVKDVIDEVYDLAVGAERVTVRLSAQDVIDEVYFNGVSLKHLIPNIGSGVGEMKTFTFTPVAGGVLAIAAHDNTGLGNSASLFMEAKSTNPASAWNFQLHPGNSSTKSFGCAGDFPPHGWFRNHFDDRSWKAPTAETHNYWSKAHGMSPGVWHDAQKHTFYRIKLLGAGVETNETNASQENANVAELEGPNSSAERSLEVFADQLPSKFTLLVSQKDKLEREAQLLESSIHLRIKGLLKLLAERPGQVNENEIQTLYDEATAHNYQLQELRSKLQMVNERIALLSYIGAQS